MTTPLVFLHRSYADFFQWNLLHSSRLNRPIFTLTDRPYLSSQWVNLRHFKSTPLDSHYIHLSAVSPKFEFFCFQRWFVLKAFLEQERLSTFIHLDSDCVLYDATYTTDKMTLSADLGDPNDAFTKSGHCMFSNLETLTFFCEFVLQYYTNPQKLSFLKQLKQEKIKVGGVCDMTLLGLFAQAFPEKVLLTQTPINGVCFDHNISVPNGFQLEQGRKKIRMEDGIPYGFLEDGTKIRFQNLHFQGGAKALMKPFLWGDPSQFTTKSTLQKWKEQAMLFLQQAR